MKVIELTSENHKKLLAAPKYVIKFYAQWCGPCKMLAPVVEEAAANSEVPVYSLDVDNADLKTFVQNNNIHSIPAMLFFVNGEAVEKKQGFMPKAQVEAFLKSH